MIFLLSLSSVRIITYFSVAMLLCCSAIIAVLTGIHMWPDTWKLLQQSDCASDQWVATYCQSIVASNTVFLRLVMSADIFEDEDFQFSSKVTCFLSQDEMEAFCKQTATLAEVVNKDKDNDKDDTTPGPSHYLRLFFQYRTLLFQLQEAMDDLINLSLTLPLSTRGNNSSAQQIAQMMKALDAQDNAVEVENTRCLLESLQKVYSLSHALHAVLAEINACPESKTTTATAADSPSSSSKQCAVTA